MLARILIPLLISAGAAFAHELPAAHAHPHGDWGGTLALLAAAAVLSALLVLPRRAARRSKDDKRDTR